MKLTVQDFAEVVAVLRGEQSDTSAQEKRRAVRMAVQSKLIVGVLKDEETISRTFSVLSRDISLAGIGLMQSVALQQGQQFVIGLPRKDPKPPLLFVTTVLHCRPMADGLYGLGCEFVKQASKTMADKLLSDQNSEHARIRNSVLG
jgi:hypothetical protein